MNSATIAAALASFLGATTPPENEEPIALATHELPDELKAAELPALLVWPPEEEVKIDAATDRSILSYPCILYLARSTRTTQARIAALYAWRDVARVIVPMTHAHLLIEGVSWAMPQRVVVNDPADVTYGLVNYDTIRIDMGVRIYEAHGIRP